MNKALWITAALTATAFTAGTVYFNHSAQSGTAMQKQAKISGRASPASDLSQPLQPVVIEFFTSQGCSSCPPADRLAARLAAEPGVLVIQRPVTYWDRLGWKDTLGKPENTALQRAYARRGLGGRNGIYTPQAVVNGSKGVVGSKERDVRGLIAQARFADRPDIEFKAAAHGAVAVMITGARTAAAANVQLVGLDRTEDVRIGRGENGGRIVTYTNIYKGERPLGQLGGHKASYVIGSGEKRIAGANAYAVIVRDGRTGPILTGRMLPGS